MSNKNAHDDTSAGGQATQKLAKQLGIVYPPSAMGIEEVRNSLHAVIDHYRQNIGSDEAFLTEANLASSIIICAERIGDLPSGILELVAACADSSSAKSVASGIQLSCGILSIRPSPSRALRKRVFDVLMAQVRKGKLAGAADQAICGLMLIASRLTRKEREAYLRAVRRRIKKGYRNPVVDEFLAEVEVFGRSAERYDRLLKDHKEALKKTETTGGCSFIAALSRKGGTGKTTVLLGVLVYLRETFPQYFACDESRVCVIDLDCAGPSWPFLFPITLPDTSGSVERAVFLNSYLEHGIPKNAGDGLFFRVDTGYELNDGTSRDVGFDVAFVNPLHGALARLSRLFDSGNAALLDRFKSLFAYLQKRYEYVLVDAPPGLHEVARYISYMSYRKENWHRFMVSSPLIADVAGVAYEMDTFLFQIKERKGRDLWLLNQLYGKEVWDAYCLEEHGWRARDGLFTDIGNEWPFRGLLPDQPLLMQVLIEDIEKRENLHIRGLPFDGGLRKESWTLKKVGTEVRGTQPRSCLSALRESYFYAILQGLLLEELTSHMDKHK